MADVGVDPNMGEDADSKSRLDDIKYYTSLFLGTLCIVCVFGFLFLVPFVLDPAISTLMHDFVEEPVHCKVVTYSLKFGKRNCTWASCREGCTAAIFKCHQIRVTYSLEDYKNGTDINDIDTWENLDRIEKEINPETDEPTGKTLLIRDTPLLINIKGCGYPPGVDCDEYADRYNNHSLNNETFPCHYSKMNPWIVMSAYSRSDTMSGILCSILIPNILFVLSIIILVYWYCPYCQARCRKYEEQTDLQDNDYESDIDDFHERVEEN